MAIKNPYGVGDSGPRARDIKVTCDCCALPFVVTVGPAALPWERTCPRCKHHRLGGSAAEQIEALTDHAERSRSFAGDAYERLKIGMRERDEALAERKRFGQMLYEANEDRDYLRVQLRAFWELHPELPAGVCGCGERPCPARRAANEVAERHDRYYSRGLVVPEAM
jgi:hypothetical protein